MGMLQEQVCRGVEPKLGAGRLSRLVAGEGRGIDDGGSVSGMKRRKERPLDPVTMDPKLSPQAIGVELALMRSAGLNLDC